MTIASAVYGCFLRDSIANVKAFALNASDVIKQDLVTDTYTNDKNVHDELADVTNIVTGTNWAGAVTLASPTWTIAAGVAKFDATDVSVATTTLTGVEGDVIWDDTIAGDPLLVCVDFGTTYATVAGTFAVTWAAGGIFTITY